MRNLIQRIAASATGGDNVKTFEEVIPDYSAMGYKQFELYALGRGASPDFNKGVVYYADKAKKYGLKYSSFHLPAIEADEPESFKEAVKWAQFANELEIPVCVFNSHKKESYAKLLAKMVAKIEECKFKFNLVVQIHEGRSLESLEDVQQVLKEVDHPKVMALHELGSYHAIGISWQKVIDCFWPKIGLFHLKDMIGTQSVAFGTGEIDFIALFSEVERIGYKGNFVVELNPKDKENTNKYIKDAFQFLKQFDK